MAKYYNRHEIKKGWNHVLSPNIRELEISDLEKEVLQAIVKFRQLIFYKGSDAGLPKSLEPQLGYVPTKDNIVECVKTLCKLGYVQSLGQTSEQRKRLVHFSVNEIKIKEDSTPPFEGGLIPDFA